MLQLINFLSYEYEKIKLKDFSVLKNKTIFITGGNGLIGANILSYLQYLNKHKRLNLKFIIHSFSLPVDWIPRDDNIIFYTSDLNEYFEDCEFDYLIHAATYGQPRLFMENKLGTIKLNTETYIKLLELAKKNNAKVLYFSSSEIYGEIAKEELPVKETFNGNVSTMSPRAIYAEAKRLGEVISNIYIESGLDVKILRLAIAYGPGIKYTDSKVMSEFIKNALNLGTIEMLDAGLAVRHYGFITDIIEMSLNVLFFGKDKVYNIGGQDTKSIYEMAFEIANITNTKIIRTKENYSVCNAPKNIILDIDKYKSEFNKTSFVEFRQGLNSTVSWLRNLRK